jgi:two-component system response regulator PilR (NtrC family)
MRAGDIPLLAQHFLEKFAKANGKPTPALTQDALRLLLEHEWRGNVRELENLIERAVAFSNSAAIAGEDLAGWLTRPSQSSTPSVSAAPSDLPPDGLDLEALISGIEKDLLLKALERAKWVKKKAARLLHLNTRSFRYRLEKYSIKGGRD